MEIEMASVWRALLFLGVPFMLLVFYLQWHWARTCDRYIRVLIAQRGGGGKWEFAPKSGDGITIHNPATGESRTWPINELATIDVLYPGVGFVPAFMQKTIRLAVVNEGDWEPLLNRSPHRERIASPDVVAFLRDLAERDPKLAGPVDAFLAGVSTGPTREMIGDPAALGSLMRSGVLKALATVSDDLLEELKALRAQMARVAGLNSTLVYAGLGLALLILAFLAYQMMQLAPLVDNIEAISRALGVTP